MSRYRLFVESARTEHVVSGSSPAKALREVPSGSTGLVSTASSVSSASPKGLCGLYADKSDDELLRVAS